MATTLDSRLSVTARALARLWAQGSLPVEALRREMRQALANAHTVALLSGTGGQRSAEIDAALRTIIQGEWDELDRLIALLESQPETDIERRLLAFADALDETRADGEQLVRRDEVSPLVPAAIGGALGALLERIVSQPGRQIMPRIDSRSLGALYQAFGARLDLLSDDVASGALFVDDWHAAMMRELRLIHSAYAQVGGGSLNEARYRAQLEFLEGFRADIEAGKLSPSQIRTRARMYLDNAQASLQEAQTLSMGMPPLPAYPKSGTSSCRTNCLCRLRIEQTGPNSWHVFWLTRPAENCPECLAREREWSPLVIENGIIQPYNPIGLFA